MSKIHLESHGHGQPLVMVHGWAMHSGIWRDFARQLAEHYRVICVDLPGHGRSDEVEAFTLPNICQQLLEAIDEQHFSVLGWSLGGSVAMAMADVAPERLQRLIVMAGNPRFVRSVDWPGIDATTLDGFSGLLSTDVQQTLTRFLALQVNGLAHGKPLLQRLKQAMAECRPPSARTLMQGLDILRQADLREVMLQTGLPTGLILGGRDRLIPVECAASVKSLNARVEIDLIDDAGHAPFLSHPRQAMAAVLRMMA